MFCVQQDVRCGPLLGQPVSEHLVVGVSQGCEIDPRRLAVLSQFSGHPLPRSRQFPFDHLGDFALSDGFLASRRSI